MSTLRRIAAAALAAAGPLAGPATRADPGYYLITPYDQAGVTTAELRYWTVKPRGGAEQVWPELGLRHGVNSRWTTGLLASFIGGADLRTRASLLNWHNTVLLTQGKSPIDVGLHASLIADADRSAGRTLEWGPLLQGDIGRTRWNVNLLFERRFSTDRPRPTALKYQWRVQHRWMPGLRAGLLGFGELGDWNDWAPRARQSHRAGPTLSAEWPLASGRSLHVDAGVLSGSTYAQHGRMVTLHVAASFP